VQLEPGGELFSIEVKQGTDTLTAHPKFLTPFNRRQHKICETLVREAEMARETMEAAAIQAAAETAEKEAATAAEKIAAAKAAEKEAAAAAEKVTANATTLTIVFAAACIGFLAMRRRR